MNFRFFSLILLPPITCDNVIIMRYRVALQLNFKLQHKKPRQIKLEENQTRIVKL